MIPLPPGGAPEDHCLGGLVKPLSSQRAAAVPQCFAEDVGMKYCRAGRQVMTEDCGG